MTRSQHPYRRVRLQLASLLIIFISLFSAEDAVSQYIDKAEVVPWGSCPVVCGEGSFRVKLFRFEGQNSIGNEELTISAGGTQLNITRYSLDDGDSWINGSFPVNGGTNQTDIIFEVDVPDGSLGVGTHNVQLGLTNGFTSNSIFEGDGGCQTLTVQEPGNVTEVDYFPDVWTGYVFDDGGEKPCFFDIPYEGTFTINDLDFSGTFGTGNGNTTNPFPGTQGVDYDATNLTTTFDDFFSVRYTRIEDFEPGMYTFTFNVDDGMRVYVNGDKVLDMWGQNDATGTQVSEPICLSGPTDLLLEYYEWMFEAEIDFSVQKVSALVIPELEYADVCEGQSVAPSSAMPAGTFEFAEDPGGGASINASTGEVTAGGAASGETYTVWFTESGGQCSNPISATVNVIACSSNPSFTIDDYCEGGTAPAPVLNANWVTGGTWSITPADGTTIDANGQITGGVGGTTYTVEYEYDDNGTQTISDQLTVTALDGADFSYADVCEGQSGELPVAGADYTAGGTYSLTTDPGDGVAVDQSTGIVTGGTGAGSPYSITYTTAGTCPASGTANMTFSDAATANFTFDDWCFDDAQSSIPVLDDGTTTGGTFSFNPAPGDGATIDGTTGEISNWTADQIYDVEYSTGGDCPAIRNVQVTTISESISFSYDPFCAGGDSEAAIEDPGFIAGGTYSFATDPGDGATIDGTTGVISNGVYATGSYDVTYNVTSTCTGNPITAQATATILESVEVLIHPTDVSVCEDNDVVFQASGAPNGVTYTWQVNDGGGWTDIAAGAPYSGETSFSLSITDPDAALTGNQYRALIGNNCASEPTDPATLTVNGATLAITGDTIVCAGQPAALQVTEGMDSYTWVSSLTGNDVLSDSSSLTFTPQDQTTLTVFGTALGCEAVVSASVEVIIDPFPDAGPDQEVCPGALVQVGENSNATWDYEWSLVANGEVVSTDMNYEFAMDSAVTLQVLATTVEGCSRADTVVVSSLGDMTYYIPNAFTPNDGDGLNTIYDLVGEGITEYTGMIFDRWGDKLYEWDNTQTGWNGTFKDKPVEPEVYVVKFEISSECIKNVRETGRVTIWK